MTARPFHNRHSRRTVHYIGVRVEGWQIYVDSILCDKQPRVWKSVEAELGRQLLMIGRVVPDAPLKKIRQVTLWIHIDAPVNIALAYHPSAEYLRQHDLNPDMAKGVEIGRAENLVLWSYDQPWCIMHELAHAYHDQSPDRPAVEAQIKAAYDAAMAARRYDKVLYGDSREGKAYAATNPTEYFAETSEAYFGTNDAYPFVRAELQRADPDGFKLMQNIWGAPQRRPPGT